MHPQFGDVVGLKEVGREGDGKEKGLNALQIWSLSAVNAIWSNVSFLNIDLSPGDTESTYHSI